MDRTLLVLLADAWKSGEQADAGALVDRSKEACSNEGGHGEAPRGRGYFGRAAGSVTS
jgi:hypothetical protein